VLGEETKGRSLEEISAGAQKPALTPAA
jgi:hypothetical protein